jgi:hypothetical protein
MKIMDEPLFMTDNDWYYYDEDECILKLTEQGLKNEEVVKSYKEFYEELDKMYIDKE